MRDFFKKCSYFIAALSLHSAFAASIPLSNLPVLDTAGSPPNILLFIDNSANMSINNRMSIAKSAANTLVEDLKDQDVRLGFATFYHARNSREYDGLYLLVGIDNISGTYRDVLDEIDDLSAGGVSPLTQAVYQFGRYLVQNYNNNLVLHPEQNNESRERAYNVFEDPPAEYARGVSSRSPIQDYCQKTFLVMITAGVADPWTPSNFPLAGYYTGTDDPNQYLLDIGNALFDIDLRPDQQAPPGVIKKNNAATYPVGFANNTLLSDLATAAGGVFLFAADSDALVTALEQATSALLSYSNTAAAVAFNSAATGDPDSVYIASYDTRDWSGSLKKQRLNPTTGNLGSVAWDASTILDNTAYTQRTLFTYNASSNRAVAFQSLSDLSSSQQADLSSGVSSSTAQSRLNYLRGDRQNEGSIFRTRGSVLGDIINAGPLYVGEPDSGWPDLTPFPSGNNAYSQFKIAEANREGVVYVGANDGMLHAFNSSNGRELFGYIPNSLFSSAGNAGLHFLTMPSYEHRFYVDLPLTVADAYISTHNSGRSWHTILLGGERSGGQGYFALDITNPNQFSLSQINNIFLWEFSSADDSRLGYTYSRPVIGLMNNGRWAAIFGNGYNAPGTKDAVLFIVYLDGGTNGVWQEGRDYLVFDTREGSNGSPNGLSSPLAVDLDGNGTIDRIYAGDYEGNLWAFDVSSQQSNNWDIAYGRGNRPRPLFSGSALRPITTKPVAVINPDVTSTNSNYPNTIVMFGTGSLLTSSDKNERNTQYFYGVWDHGDDNIGNSRLVEQSYTSTSGTRRLTDYSIPYEEANRGRSRDGWRIPFYSGERIVTNPVTRGGIVLFSTTIPEVNDVCAYGGSGYLMAAKVENGGQPSFPVFDVNNDDQLNENDQINGNYVSGIAYEAGFPAELALFGDYLYVPTSSGQLEAFKIFSSTVNTGRLSWKEIEGSS